jgi:ubiquitin carboxyl-terminal hydrolase 14
MKCDEASAEEPTISNQDFVRINCHISVNVNYLQQGLTEGLTEKIEKNSGT